MENRLRGKEESTKTSEMATAVTQDSCDRLDPGGSMDMEASGQTLDMLFADNCTWIEGGQGLLQVFDLGKRWTQ